MRYRLMLLWTWQRKEFSITDGNTQVDSRRYSDHLRCDCSSAGFKNAYKDLWRTLGTDQFHWYYTQEKDAKSPKDINQGKVLWTVEAPEEDIFRRVCPYAWTTLAGEPIDMPPDWFQQVHKAGGQPYRYARDFMTGWLEMSREDLLDSLIVRCAHVGCTQILLQHPIPKEWVAKEPEEYSQISGGSISFTAT